MVAIAAAIIRVLLFGALTTVMASPSETEIESRWTSIVSAIGGRWEVEEGGQGVRAIKTATSKDQGCMDCSPPQFHPQLYLSDALRASGSRADGRFLPPSSQSQKAPSWGARQALTCRPTFAQSTPMVCPPVAPEQPPEKHEMRSAVVRAGRPAVIKMNSMGGNIDNMGEDLERARGRGCLLYTSPSPRDSR